MKKSTPLPIQERKEPFVIFADIKSCAKRHFRKILLFITLFLALGFCLSVSYPPRYLIKGTYQDSSGIGREQSIAATLFRYIGIPMSHQSCTLIQSRFLLIEVIKKLGLQAVVDEETTWERYQRTIRENLRIEAKKPISHRDCFVFRQVDYEGEKTKNYQLIFSSPTEFEIWHSKRGRVSCGKLGENVSFDQISLFIVRSPKTLKLDFPYPLSIVPSSLTYKAFKKKLTIESHLKDEKIYELSFLHRDPKFGKEFVNCLMDQYQKYLFLESKRIAFEQMVYLEKRKEELCTTMDKHLEGHVAHLKNTLGGKGFLSLSQLLQTLARKKQSFLERQMAIHHEEESLDSWMSEGQNTLMEGELASVQKEIYSLKKERDIFDLAFLFKKKRNRAFYPPYSPREDLFHHVNKLDQITWDEALIELAEQGERPILYSLFPSLFHAIDEHSKARMRNHLNRKSLNDLFFPQSSELKQVRQEKGKLKNYLQLALSNQELSPLTHMTKEDVISHIEHQLRLVSLRENILRERLFYPHREKEVFQGIDLKTARTLYRDYVRQRDQYEANAHQLTFAKNHLENPDFEYISLTQILPDEVSQNLARDMGKIVQTMRDERNLSERDLERMSLNLKKQRQNLSRHIDQTIDLCHLQIDLIEEKIHTVQSVILELLNQEIALLDQQVTDRIIQKKRALQAERKLIENRLEEIKGELTMIPDQWLKENKLQFSSEMNMKMLEGLVQLVESKNIEHHLNQIQSKPVDEAYTDMYPVSPHIRIFTLIGGIIGCVVGFVFVISLDFSRGFPLTLKNLKLQQRTVCGRFKRCFLKDGLQHVSDDNLQVLRELSRQLPNCNGGIVAALITGGESHYSRPFAELLTIEGKKVLHLDLDSESGNSSGLISYLKGETEHLNLKREHSYDTVDLGENSRFNMDLLKHPRFHLFLEKMKGDYDVILLQSSSLINASESHFLMTLANSITLTLRAETLSQLRPYFLWEDEEGGSLSFVE